MRDDPAAQVLALYLQTAPTANLIGLYYLPFTAICHETGLSPGAVEAGLQRLEREGFARYDRAEEIVWVVNMAREQVGRECRAEGRDGKKPDKKRPAILRELERCGSPALRQAFTKHYADPYDLTDAPSKGHLRPSHGAIPADPLPLPVVVSRDIQPRGMPLGRGISEAVCPPDPDPDPAHDPDPASEIGGAAAPAVVAPLPTPAWDDARFSRFWTDEANVTLTVDKGAPHFHDAMLRIAEGARAAGFPVEEWARRLLDRFKLLAATGSLRQRSVETFWAHFAWCEGNEPVPTRGVRTAQPKRGPAPPDEDEQKAIATKRKADFDEEQRRFNAQREAWKRTQGPPPSDVKNLLTDLNKKLAPTS